MSTLPESGSGDEAPTDIQYMGGAWVGLTGLAFSKSITMGTIPMTLLSTAPVVQVVQPLCSCCSNRYPATLPYL